MARTWLVTNTMLMMCGWPHAPPILSYSMAACSALMKTVSGTSKRCKHTWEMASIWKYTTIRSSSCQMRMERTGLSESHHSAKSTPPPKRPSGLKTMSRSTLSRMRQIFSSWVSRTRMTSSEFNLACQQRQPLTYGQLRKSQSSTNSIVFTLSWTRMHCSMSALPTISWSGLVT